MSVNSYDLDVMVDPVGRKINAAAVSAELDLLLDHFFPIDLELHFAFRDVAGGILFTLGFLFPWHAVTSSLGKMKIPIALRLPSQGSSHLFADRQETLGWPAPFNLLMPSRIAPISACKVCCNLITF